MFWLCQLTLCLRRRSPHAHSIQCAAAFSISGISVRAWSFLSVLASSLPPIFCTHLSGGSRASRAWSLRSRFCTCEWRSAPTAFPFGREAAPKPVWCAYCSVCTFFGQQKLPSTCVVGVLMLTHKFWSRESSGLCYVKLDISLSAGVYWVPTGMRFPDVQMELQFCWRGCIPNVLFCEFNTFIYFTLHYTVLLFLFNLFCTNN